MAKTLLRTETTRLPNNQTQVIVLEEAPAASGEEPGSRILIRGDAWNASSIGGMVAVSNLLVQPIDKVEQSLGIADERFSLSYVI